MGTTEHEPTPMDLLRSEQVCQQHGWSSPEAAAVPVAALIGIGELADALHVSEWTVRQLLNRDAIPGARRKTPGLAKSTWLIPATAPSLYLARFEG